MSENRWHSIWQLSDIVQEYPNVLRKEEENLEKDDLALINIVSNSSDAANLLKHSETTFKKGMELYNLKKFSEAEEAFKDAYFSGFNPEALYYEGLAVYQREYYFAAFNKFTNLISVDKSHSGAYKFRALCALGSLRKNNHSGNNVELSQEVKDCIKRDLLKSSDLGDEEAIEIYKEHFNGQ